MQANKVNEFKPISLVTSLYKIVAKVLAERLKKVLLSIIADAQVTFVEGRQILDAMLVAAETVGDWNSSNRKGYLIKLDYENSMTWLIGSI